MLYYIMLYRVQVYVLDYWTRADTVHSNGGRHNTVHVQATESE